MLSWFWADIWGKKSQTFMIPIYSTTVMVRCGCGHWIHEDCIDEVVTGKDGKDIMCSNSVL